MQLFAQSNETLMPHELLHFPQGLHLRIRNIYVSFRLGTHTCRHTHTNRHTNTHSHTPLDAKEANKQLGNVCKNLNWQVLRKSRSYYKCSFNLRLPICSFPPRFVQQLNTYDAHKQGWKTNRR